MEDQAEPIADDGPDESPEMPRKSSLMPLIKAVAFVSVIVLLQVAAASVLMPTVEETTKIANQLAATGDSHDIQNEMNAGNKGDEPEMLAPDNVREVSLGSYHIVTQDPETGASLNVDFDLFATVEEDDEGEFYSLYESNSNRIREQIYITVRGMEVTDLTDPTLGLIKRKILEKTNRALGKPLLQEAVFSKFSFVER